MNSNKFLLALIGVVILIKVAFALPTPAAQIYGFVYVSNASAPFGTVVTATDTNGTFCGNFTVLSSGKYGLLSCDGDDPSTGFDEGLEDGESIKFFVDGDEIIYFLGDRTWHSGAFLFVNISPVAHFLTCGNGVCEPEFGESCITCPEDCGECPPPNGTTTNTTNSSGGGSEGGDSGGGSGSGSGSMMTSPYGMPVIPPAVCVESWLCGEWSECGPDGLQYRQCVDRRGCGTTDNKPVTVQNCTYHGDCFDGIKNFHDGAWEEGVDCGGPCPPCANCSDSIRNFHDGAWEEGVDCGGPCAPCGLPEVVVAPVIENATQLGLRCGDGICTIGEECSCWTDCNRFPWDVFLFLLLICGLEIGLGQLYAKHYRRNSRLKRLPLLRKYKNIKKNVNLLGAIIFFLNILITIYLYIFGACPPDLFRFLWIFIVSLSLLPLLAYLIIHYYEYDEKKKNKALMKLIERHESEIESLLGIENDILIEIESELSEYITRLSQDTARSKYFRNFPVIDKVYSVLQTLVEEYRSKSNPMGVEEELIGLLDYIMADRAFVALSKKDKSVGVLYAKFKLLFEQYATKQEIYEKIDSIVKERNEMKKKLKQQQKSSK